MSVPGSLATRWFTTTRGPRGVGYPRRDRFCRGPQASITYSLAAHQLFYGRYQFDVDFTPLDFAQMCKRPVFRGADQLSLSTLMNSFSACRLFRRDFSKSPVASPDALRA
jgi:hypothetical protein